MSEKVLDLLDEISNQLPGELKQAKTIVDSRSELITNAKREAENIMKSAQAQARQLVSQEAIYLEAKNQANDMVRAAQDKIKELKKKVTNDYVDDPQPHGGGRRRGSGARSAPPGSSAPSSIRRPRTTPRSSKTCKPAP